MRTFIYISLLLGSTFLVGITVDVYVFDNDEKSIFEFPSEGSSEKELSENAEDDSEKDVIELIESPSIIFKKFGLAVISIQFVQKHFLKIPTPPPEVI